MYRGGAAHFAPSGAAGSVTVMDLSPLAAQGTRIHPTPRQFNVPLLMLDRVAGAAPDVSDDQRYPAAISSSHQAGTPLISVSQFQ